MNKFYFFLLLSIFNFDLSAKSFVPDSFTAKFEQVFKSSISGKIKKSKGIIEYKYPGNIRIEVKNSKGEIIFVSNSKKSWYYRSPFLPGSPGELKIKENGDMLVSSFLDALRSGITTNENYQVKTIGNKEELKFKNTFSSKIGAKRANLFFEKKSRKTFDNLSAIDIIETNGKKITIKLLNIDKNTKLNKSRFTFTPPENTNISAH